MTAELEEGEWSAARPGRTLPPGKTRYPLYRRLGGLQGRSGQAENLVPTDVYIYIYIYIYNLQRSQRLKSIKLFRDGSHITWLNSEKAKVSRTISVIFIREINKTDIVFRHCYSYSKKKKEVSYAV